MVADNGSGPKLIAALIAAKKKFKTLTKNKVNPHFKSRYADLAAVHAAVDDALADNGLTIMQPINFDKETGPYITTELYHVSGECKTAKYILPGGVDSQKLAAAITYGRRNSLCALLGIPADDDDDGETEQNRPPQETGNGGAKPSTSTAAAKAPAIARPNHVVYGIVKVESPANGKWKITCGDPAATEFHTAKPEDADVARSCVGKCRASIQFLVQGNGLKRITAIEPEKGE
jgi:hypothetical protein